jgi:hypothetical protein
LFQGSSFSSDQSIEEYGAASSSGWGAIAPRPGLILLIPIVDRAWGSPDRRRSSAWTSSPDNVPVNAVIYFRVLDANKAF